MTVPFLSRLLTWFAVLAAASVLLTRAAVAQPAALRDLATGLRIDAESISLSGISSGAYMAQQFHIAHSAHVSGVGLVAGGPYRCASGTYLPFSWFDLTGLYAATSVCSDTNPFWFYQGPPDSEHSLNATRDEARRGAIDDPGHLRGDRIWLLSGDEDTTVPRGVVDALDRYYRAFVDSDNIRYVKLDGAAHAMITEDFGNACDVSEVPFISDCDFDAAGDLLAHLLGTLQPRAAQANAENLLAFDQRAFLDADVEDISMHAVAHLYLPTRCRAGASCRLHVALHGCEQHQERIGDVFFSESGYNEWAESNDIVILYPQTTATSASFFGDAGLNPKGCWDWWGYSGSDYHRKGGAQIRAVAGMINVLLGRELLRD